MYSKSASNSLVMARRFSSGVSDDHSAASMPSSRQRSTCGHVGGMGLPVCRLEAAGTGTRDCVAVGSRSSLAAGVYLVLAERKQGADYDRDLVPVEGRQLEGDALAAACSSRCSGAGATKPPWSFWAA